MAKIAKKDETVFQSLAESMIDGQIHFVVDSFHNTSGTIACVFMSLAFVHGNVF